MRANLVGAGVDAQVVAELVGVFEGPRLRLFIDEEVERVVDRHVGDEIDLDPELGHRLGEHVARQPVAVGILLVVHEMPLGPDLERMRDHPRARMRRRPQPDQLRAERDRTVVLVMRQVVNACRDGHGCGPPVLLPLGSGAEELGYRPL